MASFIRVGKHIINPAHVVRTVEFPGGLTVICSIGADVQLEGDEATAFEAALDVAPVADTHTHHA